MGLEDRDWYREEIRQRTAERNAQAYTRSRQTPPRKNFQSEYRAPTDTFTHDPYTWIKLRLSRNKPRTGFLIGLLAGGLIVVTIGSFFV